MAAAQRASDTQQLWKLACRAAEDFLEVRVRDEREAPFERGRGEPPTFRSVASVPRINPPTL
eukprot:3159517-Alexandrium_andersonii.AAC.1